MSPRDAAWLAWYMCAVSLILTALGLFLLALSRSPANAPVLAGGPAFDYWIEDTVVAVSFSTVGAVITPRLPPHNPVGWLFCTIGFVAGVGLFVAEYAIVSLLAEPGSVPSMLPSGDGFAWISSWLWVVHLGLFAFLALVFPDGKPPSPRWRPFAWLVGVVTAGGTIAVALWPETAGGLTPANSPLGIEAATDVLNPVETIMLTLGLISVLSLLVRLRHSKGVERQQVKWFAYALAVLATSAILSFVVSDTIGIRWLGGVSFLLIITGVVGVPVAVCIAILRYRLYEIDLLIYRTLVYGALTATLALIYFGGVATMQAIFRSLTGQEQQPQLAIVASTLVIAALFMPLRHRIQSFIDRRFYRRKYDARKTLEAFATKLRDETDLDALRDDLVGVVRETMQPVHVSLWLRPEMAQKGEQAD
jgi:hypothetical protein